MNPITAVTEQNDPLVEKLRADGHEVEVVTAEEVFARELAGLIVRTGDVFILDWAPRDLAVSVLRALAKASQDRENVATATRNKIARVMCEFIEHGDLFDRLTEEVQQ